MGNSWQLKEFEQELDYSFTREELRSVYPPFLESLKESVAYEHWPQLDEFIICVKAYDFESDGYDELYLDILHFTLKLMGEIGDVLAQNGSSPLEVKIVEGYPPIIWRGVDYFLAKAV